MKKTVSIAAILLLVLVGILGCYGSQEVDINLKNYPLLVPVQEEYNFGPESRYPLYIGDIDPDYRVEDPITYFVPECAIEDGQFWILMEEIDLLKGEKVYIEYRPNEDFHFTVYPDGTGTWELMRVVNGWKGWKIR